MLSITKTLDTIFARFDGMNKRRRDFLTELFEIIPCVRGRLNFINMSRYSKYNESTFRRNFSQFFDWLKFNYLILQFVFLTESETVIGAIDCSYVSKSGKHTYGLDKFWSGVANRTKPGLEVSLVSLIEVEQQRAWSLDVRQTPAGLSSKEGAGDHYTRIDFYMEQLQDCMIQVPQVKYYTADGFYAKKKSLRPCKVKLNT